MERKAAYAGRDPIRDFSRRNATKPTPIPEQSVPSYHHDPMQIPGEHLTPPPTPRKEASDYSRSQPHYINYPQAQEQGEPSYTFKEDTFNEVAQNYHQPMRLSQSVPQQLNTYYTDEKSRHQPPDHQKSLHDQVYREDKNKSVSTQSRFLDSRHSSTDLRYPAGGRTGNIPQLSASVARNHDGSTHIPISAGFFPLHESGGHDVPQKSHSETSQQYTTPMYNSAQAVYFERGQKPIESPETKPSYTAVSIIQGANEHDLNPPMAGQGTLETKPYNSHRVDQKALPYQAPVATPTASRTSSSAGYDCEERYSEPKSTPTPSILLSTSGTHAGRRPAVFTSEITVAPEESTMMGEHSSYHNNIQGDEAIRRLKQFDKHCYLTRYSEIKKWYILSVFRKDKPKDTIRHFKIELSNGKNKISGKTKEFDTIEELLTHYENNRIDQALKTIGQNCKKEEYDLAEEEREREEQRKQGAQECAQSDDEVDEEHENDCRPLLQGDQPHEERSPPPSPPPEAEDPEEGDGAPPPPPQPPQDPNGNAPPQGQPEPQGNRQRRRNRRCTIL